MTIAMRERPDGQVEIVLYRAEVVGVLADRDMAARFVTFLQQDDPDFVADEPARFATAAADVDLDLGDLGPERLPAAGSAPDAPVPAHHRQVAGLPVIAAVRPQAPVFVAADKNLTEAELEAAFERIHCGEKLSNVAVEVGITMGRMRGLWAAHCRYLQKHIAEGGQQNCLLCQRPFTPSVTSPDKCARCSHG